MNELSFRDRFFKAYLDFQAETRKHTVVAFAKYLSSKNNYGVQFSQQLVSGWLNGDFEPGEKYAPALADVLGDDIYDLLNISRPDPDLRMVNMNWLRVPEELRKHIKEEIAEYLSGSENNENGLIEDPR